MSIEKSLVIELPKAVDDDLVEFRSECAEAIEACGLKVKPLP